MSPSTLRYMLVAVLLTVQVVTVIVVLVGVRDETADQLTDNAQVTLDKLAESVTNQAEQFLQPAEDSVRITRQILQSGLISADVDQSLEKFFLAELQVNEDIQGMYLARPDGSLVAVSRDLDGFVVKTLGAPGASAGPPGEGRFRKLDVRHREVSHWREPVDSYDARTTIWYGRAIDADQLIWTDAYRLIKSSEPGITAASPVRSPDGRLAGVVGVDIRIARLSAFVATIPLVPGGSAAIVDRKRHVVAFSRIDNLTRRLDQGLVPTLDRVAGKPLRTLAGEQPATADQQAPGASSSEVAVADTVVAGSSRFTVDGRPHLGFEREFQLLDGRVNWRLLVQAPEAGFSGAFARLFTDRLWTIGQIMVIPALLAIVAIFGLTRPVFRLHQVATIDRLTGALTRDEFERRLAGMLRGRREHESDTKLVIAAFDLDGFKAVNDRHGHAAGDRVLTQFARRLRQRVRQCDLIGRVGGDEFILAIRMPAHANGLIAINRIRTGVILQPVDTPWGSHQIGATAGIATFDEVESMQQLLARADQALVTGKARRKNRCYVAPDRDANGPHTVPVPVVVRQTLRPARASSAAT